MEERAFLARNFKEKCENVENMIMWKCFRLKFIK
jgi:hypothetical protein